MWSVLLHGLHRRLLRMHAFGWADQCPPGLSRWFSLPDDFSGYVLPVVFRDDHDVARGLYQSYAAVVEAIFEEYHIYSPLFERLQRGVQLCYLYLPGAKRMVFLLASVRRVFQ